MSKKKVLITAPYFQPVVERFKKIFEDNDIEIVVPPVKERLSEEELLEFIPDIDGVICGDDQFTRNVIQNAPKLKVISKWGTGIDSIDQAACKEFYVEVKNTVDAFTDAVADSVMAYMLCFARKIPWMDREMKKGVWEKQPGVSLQELACGIIGMGHIGRAVAKRALAFGMTVLGNDIKKIDKEFLKEHAVAVVEKEDIYQNADMISINCDLNPTSFHLIDTEVFKKMAKKPFIINTARGPIIKEQDLVEALQNGLISGAGLDVFEDEPLPQGSPLLKMENVLLAPHNSNSSPQAWERVHQNTLTNLLEGLEEHEK